MSIESYPQPGTGTQGAFDDYSVDAALRVLLYSHDSWGLGHLRRSLAIADALTRRFPNSNVLVVTGSPCATQFDIPDRCDVLKLPAVSKDIDGQYISRSLSGSVSRTIDLRSRLIHESYRSFDPHVLIIDHQLVGLHGEALSTLRHARDDGKVLIYGMRDVLDEPATVAAAWDSHEMHWALKHGYDQICVYGTPEVFDPREQYKTLEPYHSKIRFTGYIVTPPGEFSRRAIPSFRKHVLVTMGGGEDGEERVETYIQALLTRPVAWDSHIITGPLMDQARVRHFKRQVHRHGLAERVRIHRFAQNLQRLLQDSDAVISMAGYNSCSEILQSGIPAVLLPRTHPRKEQLIRAERFAEMGLARCVTSDDPVVLREAVEAALEHPHTPVQRPKLNGLDRFCDIIDHQLASKSPQAHSLEEPPLKFASD